MNYIDAIKSMSNDKSIMTCSVTKDFIWYRCHNGFLEWSNNNGSTWYRCFSTVSEALCDWKIIVGVSNLEPYSLNNIFT
jgi:hypothetical protein